MSARRAESADLDAGTSYLPERFSECSWVDPLHLLRMGCSRQACRGSMVMVMIVLHLHSPCNTS